MDLLDYLNPLKHFSDDRYISFWQALFSTVLQGFWSRVFAVAFLLLAFWFCVRRRNWVIGIAFYFFTIVITYGAFLFKFLYY